MRRNSEDFPGGNSRYFFVRGGGCGGAMRVRGGESAVLGGMEARNWGQAGGYADLGAAVDKNWEKVVVFVYFVVRERLI